MQFSFMKPGAEPLRDEVLTAGKTDYRIELKAATSRPTAVASRPAREETSPIRVDQPAPDIKVTALDGTAYQLSKLKGKYVFLDFWATWCPPCRAEMPTLTKVHAAVKSRSDFVMLGISIDQEAEAVKDFAAKQKLAWPLAAGPDSGASEAASAYGVEAIPFNCLIDPDGKIIAVDIHGPDLPARIAELAMPRK
jgi:peroxiredoxin